MVAETAVGGPVPAAADAHWLGVVLLNLRIPHVDDITAARLLRGREPILSLGVSRRPMERVAVQAWRLHLRPGEAGPPRAVLPTIINRLIYNPS